MGEAVDFLVAGARYPPPSGEEASSPPPSPVELVAASGAGAHSPASAQAHAPVFVLSAAQIAAAPPLHPGWQYGFVLWLRSAGQQ
jgi:hypothetical protein